MRRVVTAKGLVTAVSLVWVRQGLSRGSSQVKIAACLCGVDDSRVAAVDPYLIPFLCGLSFLIFCGIKPGCY